MSKNEQTNPLVQNIKKISLSLIDDFPNHPYHIFDDESMAELTESIRKNGLISPVIVREKDGGRYELISGHRRKYACSVLGYEETALYELEQFAAKWDSKYPKISASWKAHWPELSTYFKYPQSVRTLIYTTNSIENFNRQLRKVSKNRSVFPNDDSLLKMLYLAQVDITRKWTGRRRDWGEIHSQLEIFFADRLPE